MAQSDASEKTVGEDTYRVLMLDPMTSGDLLVDLIDLFGPSVSIIGAGILKSKDSKDALGQLVEGLADSEGGGVGDLIGDNLERAIMGLIERMDKAKLRDIIRLMRGVTSVKKGADWPQLDSIFDAHFRGRVFAMYKWLAMAVRVQYGVFS